MKFKTEEWERIRPEFTRLYVDERKTLRQVQEILAQEHGFNASARMYKTRIDLWRLSKKRKDHEMRAVLRVAAKRKSEAGKDSSFRIRGRPITLEEVSGFFRRKNLDLIHIDFSCCPCPTPSVISCSTPKSSSGDLTSSEETEQDEESIDRILISEPRKFENIVDWLHRRSQSYRISPPVRSLDEFRNMESILFTVRDYCDASLNERSFGGDEYQLDGANGVPFHRLIQSGGHAAARNDWVTASRDLNEAFDMLNYLLLNCPMFILNVFEATSYPVLVKMDLILTEMLKFMSEMASITLGTQHPITRLTKALRENPGLRAEYTELGVLMVSEMLGAYIGPVTWEIADSTFAVGEIHYYHRRFAEARYAFRNLQPIDQALAGECSWEHCLSLVTEARCLIHLGELSDANIALAKASKLASYLPLQQCVGIRARCLHSSAEIARLLQDHDLAKNYLEQAEELLKSVLDSDELNASLKISPNSSNPSWQSILATLAVQSDDSEGYTFANARWAWRYCEWESSRMNPSL